MNPGTDIEAGTGRDGWQALARSAHRRERPDGAGPLRELLVFSLAGTPYAVATERVREIVRLRPITPLPRVPGAIRGVISLRGEIAQVLDLPQRFGLDPLTPTRRTRIIVLRAEEGDLTGLLVDAVREVLRVPEDSIGAAPSGESPAIAALCARDDEFISLLDLDRVLDLQEAMGGMPA